jgi:thymidylate kinase
MVYQRDTGKVKKIDTPPDYLFYFDISPEIAMERIVSRGETREVRKNYFVRTNGRNIECVETYSHIRIDAGQSIDRVSAGIINAIFPNL